MYRNKIFIAIIVAALYAIGLRIVFGVDSWEKLYSVMSVTFLFLGPAIVGAIAIYFSPEENVKNKIYRYFVPWVPVILFMIFTLFFAWEGWACWIMALPLFLGISSLGGALGAYLKFRKKKNNRLYISLLMFAPLVISPIEQAIGSIPGSYKAYTFIDIQSDATTIWNNVTRVKEIPAKEDSGWLNKFLGFPRPLSAELDTLAVGGYREAIFTNGLIFQETVTEYQDKQKMVFTIKAYPHEIPSTTLDEHVVIGGQFFDVLNGTYELERLNESAYRLHLYSNFKLKTTFNFYASWWATWIMKDIQNNILKVQKERSEHRM